jgi:hypothetical protein
MAWAAPLSSSAKVSEIVKHVFILFIFALYLYVYSHIRELLQSLHCNYIYVHVCISEIIKNKRIVTVTCMHLREITRQIMYVSGINTFTVHVLWQCIIRMCFTK